MFYQVTYFRPLFQICPYYELHSTRQYLWKQVNSVCFKELNFYRKNPVQSLAWTHFFDIKCSCKIAISDSDEAKDDVVNARL